MLYSSKAYLSKRNPEVISFVFLVEPYHYKLQCIAEVEYNGWVQCYSAVLEFLIMIKKCFVFTWIDIDRERKKRGEKQEKNISTEYLLLMATTYERIHEG